MRLFPLLLLCATAVSAAAGDFTYKAPTVKDPLFAGEGVALLESEREKIASNIAGFVCNSLSSRPHPRELENARRLIGLALHLHPRDRNSLVANAQLQRGLNPKKVEVDYQPSVLAELLLARRPDSPRQGHLARPGPRRVLSLHRHGGGSGK